MIEQMVGRFMAFRDSGNGDEVANDGVFVEVTDFSKSGEIELAFTAPLPGKPRIYLRVSLPEIIESAMQKNGSDG